MKNVCCLVLLLLPSLIFAQAYSDNPIPSENKIIASLSTDEVWSTLLPLLKSIQEESSLDHCESNPVIRLLQGHAAMASGVDNNTAMEQFYCPSDSVGSPSLAFWREWTKRYMEAKPEVAHGYYLYADALARDGGLSESLPFFDKAIELDPEHYLAYSNRGTVKWILKKMKSNRYCDECVEDWLQATEIKADYTDGFLNMGVGNILGTSTRSEVLLDLDKAIELDPENKMAYNGKKVLYHKEGDGRRYFELIPKAYDTPFGVLDQHIAIDSVKGARGAFNMVKSGLGDVVWSGVDLVQHTYNTFKNYSVDGDINMDAAFKAAQSLRDLSRGGIYSLQMADQNSHVNLSISGTWFLINYPSTNQIRRR